MLQPQRLLSHPGISRAVFPLCPQAFRFGQSLPYHAEGLRGSQDPQAFLQDIDCGIMVAVHIISIPWKKLLLPVPIIICHLFPTIVKNFFCKRKKPENRLLPQNGKINLRKTFFHPDELYLRSCKDISDLLVSIKKSGFIKNWIPLIQSK